jgi:hypothetical protein
MSLIKDKDSMIKIIDLTDNYSIINEINQNSNQEINKYHVFSTNENYFYIIENYKDKSLIYSHAVRNNLKSIKKNGLIKNDIINIFNFSSVKQYLPFFIEGVGTKIFDLNKNEIIHESNCGDIVFSPTGKYIVTQNGYSWSIFDNNFSYLTFLHCEERSQVKFTFDEKYLILHKCESNKLQIFENKNENESGLFKLVEFKNQDGSYGETIKDCVVYNIFPESNNIFYTISKKSYELSIYVLLENDVLVQYKQFNLRVKEDEFEFQLGNFIYQRKNPDFLDLNFSFDGKYLFLNIKDEGSMIIDADSESLKVLQKLNKGFIKEKSMDYRYIIVKRKNDSYYVDLNQEYKEIGFDNIKFEYEKFYFSIDCRYLINYGNRKLRIFDIENNFKLLKMFDFSNYNDKQDDHNFETLSISEDYLTINFFRKSLLLYKITDLINFDFGKIIPIIIPNNYNDFSLKIIGNNFENAEMDKDNETLKILNKISNNVINENLNANSEKNLNGKLDQGSDENLKGEYWDIDFDTILKTREDLK